MLTLQQFSHYCGPAALAAVTGVDTVTAAGYIRDVEGEASWKGGLTTYRGLLRAVRAHGYPNATLREVPETANGRGQLTLGQFLRSYDGLAILMVRAGPREWHYVVVEGGEVIEDNRQPLGPRRRVWAIIYSNGEGTK